MPHDGDDRAYADVRDGKRVEGLVRRTSLPRSIYFVLGAGLLVHVVVAFIHEGVRYDIDSYRIVARGLAEERFDVYSVLKANPGHRWPYPPGFFPWFAIAGTLFGPGSFAFAMAAKVPFIVCDIGIAAVVALYLHKRNATPRTQIVACALIALGPIFVLIASYHGQLDAVATLPAVAALYLWETWDDPRRAAAAGLLIGAGAAIKTVPIVLLVALWPSIRSRKEFFALHIAAGAVPALVLAPFFLSTPSGVVAALTHAGIPGIGGLSLVVQPSYAGWWMGRQVEFTAIGSALWQGRGVLTIAVVGAVAAIGLYKRVPAVQAATLLWLAVYAFAPNFAFQYLVWGLPVFVMAGYIRSVGVAQVMLLVPAALLYLPALWSDASLNVYVALMVVAWVAATVALALHISKIWRADTRAVMVPA